MTLTLADWTPDIAARAAALDPLVLRVPLPAATVLLTAYATISPFFPDVRARAYILSVVSSATMTLASLPFVARYLSGGLPAVWAAGQDGWTRTLSTVLIPAFATYLFMDLAVGWFAYRSQIGFLTGWFHHTVYMVLMVHLATSRQSPVFATAAIMELPTFDLGISHLFPAVRSDERFLALMLVARILFNMVLCVDSLRPASIALMDNSWIPATMLTAALSLHASWMYGGVKGYLRRQSRARAAAKAAKAAAAEKLHIETETERVALESPADGLATPEESPLVTPYTPSQPSMYIPQHLFPNISIPTMPNLPIPNIPTLSGMAAALPQAKANLDNLNFGLREAKEAIRERWEEQRERISAARFGLRLRRANTDGDQQGILVDDIES